MKKRLIAFVKYNKVIYLLYFYTCCFVLNFMKLFIKTDPRLILINSYGGKKYDDSPKALYEGMLDDERFKDFKFVWAFHEPEKFNVPGAKIIKTDTIEYFKTALKAGCWITNSSIERGLKFKNRKTFYFNTWHGTPIKKMGSDLSENNKSFAGKVSQADITTVQGDFELEVFSRVYNIEKDKFLRSGLPRNDKLVNCEQAHKDRVKEKLHLPADKKIILYAPTFREFERDGELNVVLSVPMDIKRWKRELGDEYVLLFRAHYEVSKAMEIVDDDFVRNMSDYPSLEDLMIVADVLISDYSSIFFDFAVMGKPMFHFTYDYAEYSEKRGMYFDISKEINGADNEKELIDIMKGFDHSQEEKRTESFQKKYVNYFGNAVKQSLDCIIANIGG